MFDFYADAYNYEALRGSNASPALLAYTYTFGGAVSLEDGVSRRDTGSVLSFATVAGTGIPLAGFGIGAGGGTFWRHRGRSADPRHRCQPSRRSALGFCPALRRGPSAAHQPLAGCRRDLRRLHSRPDWDRGSRRREL